MVSNFVDQGASKPHNYTCDLNDEHQQLFKNWATANPQILESYTQLVDEFLQDEANEEKVLRRIKLELEKRKFPNNVEQSFQQ